MQPSPPETPPSVDASGKPTRAHPRLAGVALAQLAGVRAGISAGWPLEEVLQNEGVAAAIYARAEAAWDERLSQDDADELQELFDTCLADAAERYRRPIPPLDEDLGAWLDFARHFGAQEEPVTWLSSLELRPADVFALHRWWSNRLAEEPPLREQAHRLLAATPGEIPALRPGQGVLKPPPPLGELEELPEDGLELDDDLDELDEVDDEDDDSEHLEDPAAFFAPLPHEAPLHPQAEEAVEVRAAPPPAPVAGASALQPDDVEPLPPPLVPAQQLTPMDTLPPISAAGAPSMPFQRLPLPQPVVSFGAEPAAPVQRAKQHEADADDLLAQTLPPTSLVPTNPLPFRDGQGQGQSEPAAKDFTTETMPTGIVVPREALPFQPVGSANASAPSSPGPMTSSELGTATMPLKVFVPGEALPFGKETEKRIEEAGADTLWLKNFVPKETLPFRRTEQQSTPTTSAVPATAAIVDETMPVKIIAPSEPLPFQPPQEAEDPLTMTIVFFDPKKATPPELSKAKGGEAARQKPVAPPLKIPELSVEAYASLCAKLATSPGEAEQIFARYGLAEPGVRAAADEAWKERLRKDSSLYQEWLRLYRIFHERWSGAQRRV